ncbi:MAG: peptidylprolyl isomerase [Candidatus Hydrogenedentota bacterium]
MSIRSLFPALVAALACICAMGVHAETLDQIVATVDDEVILYSDLIGEVQPLLQDLNMNAPDRTTYKSERDQLLREALTQAIDRKILYREAVLAGLQIEDEAVEDRVEQVMENYESPAAFRRSLEEAGETMSDFREGLRKQIIAISMGVRKRRQFEERIVISEAEARQYFEDHRAEFERPERVKVRRIFLSAGEDEDERDTVRARLEALAQEARLGADFAELARAHSEGPDAEEGGLVGWVTRGDLVAALEEEVFSLDTGAISGIVETEWGFHLLKVEQHEEAGMASFEEARSEIEPKLRAEYANEKYQQWLAELRKRRRVRTLL